MSTSTNASGAAGEAANGSDKPVFRAHPAGTSFYVRLPKGMSDKWTKKLGGTHIPSTNEFIFLIGKLAEVEQKVGFAAGQSGLHDPSKHFKICIESSVYGAKGLEVLKEELKKLGIKWNGHKFVGQDIEQVPAILAITGRQYNGN